MLSALSNINRTAHQVAVDRPQVNRVRAETAVAALAALSPAQPLPSVSDPFEDDESGYSFLYRPNGLPSAGDSMTFSAPAAQTVASGNASPSRLAMESTELSSLLSSLMAPSAATSSAAPQAAADARLPVVQETLIAKLYRQF